MKPLAEKALTAHREGKTKFFPDRWTKVYTNWLEGIRDWCISRQIWWGHQIPVWYDSEGGVFVARSEEEAKAAARQKHGSEVSLERDPDVLDTWFSSWLWPFSTLGWPEKTADLKRFYPTSDLCTAPEIIFFWVARMIMSGLEFEGEVPFSRIYIHGTVRAASGLKMSKSLGNAIDPLEVIEEMGSDALRYSLVMLSAQDVYLSREKFEVGRNFTNKIWNASRFVFMNLKDFKHASASLDLDPQKLPIAERWILSRLEKVTTEIEKNLGSFSLSQASSELYHFIWDDFCDWYIELAKPTLLGATGAEKENTQKVMFFVLEKILRLLHPFMPFLTEELWQVMKEASSDKAAWPETLMQAAWPFHETVRFQDEGAENYLRLLQQAVSGIRDLRVNLNIQPGKALKAVIVVSEKETLSVVEKFSGQLKTLARLEAIEFKSEFQKSKAYVGNSFPGIEVFIHLEGIVDPDKERVRLQAKVKEVKGWVESLEKKLSNDNFVKNAPADVVGKERAKLDDAKKVLGMHEELLRLFQ